MKDPFAFNTRHLTPHVSAPTRDLEELVRRVDHTYFRGGQVSWSPNADPRSEQSFLHNLGRVPAGMYLVCQECPTQWYVTVEQKARWTDRRVFFSLVPSYSAGSGAFTSNFTASQVISLSKPLRSPLASVHFGVRRQTSIVPEILPPRVSAWRDQAGVPTVTPPFYGFDVSSADGLSLSADWNFAWRAYDELTPDLKYVWQVY